MTKQVKKALDANPDDWRSVPQSYMVEGVYWHLQIVI